MSIILLISSLKIQFWTHKSQLMRSRFFSSSFVYSPLSDSIVVLLFTLFTEISSTLARPDCSSEHPYIATTGLKEAYKSGGNAPVNKPFLTFRHSSPPSLTVDLKGPIRQPSAMPLKLNPRSPLPPFSFSTSPSPASSPHAQSRAGDTPRPPADFLPEKDMHMFGTYPLLAEGEEGRGLVKCGKCGKVGMEWAAAEHRREYCFVAPRHQSSTPAVFSD